MNSPSSFEDSEDSSLGNNLNTEDKILKSKEKKTTKFQTSMLGEVTECQVKMEQNQIQYANRQGYYRQESWLFEFCKLNQIPFRWAMQFTDQVKKSMQGKKIVKRTSFNKVQFKSFEHKQPYFCTFHFLSEGMMTIKIRDKTSTVVYLKKIQQKDIGKDIYNLLKKLKDSWLIIFDQVGRANLFTTLRTQNISSNWVHFHALNPDIKQVEVETNCIYQPIHNYMVYYPKKAIKRIPPLTIIFDRFHMCENQDQTNIAQFLGPNNLMSHNPQEYCLVANIIREQLTDPDPCSFEKIGTCIMKAEYHLQQTNQKYQSQKDNHFLKSQGQKMLCSYCNRKNTQIICSGCTQIQGKQIHLCVKNCFKQYHRSITRVSSDKIDQVCPDLGYFDIKCKFIFDSVNQLIINGITSEDLMLYYQYVRLRLIQGFNQIAERKMK